jgi:type II secretion system protein G
MNSQKKRRGDAGVTLIEMLVVVSIIALFAALVAPSMFQQGDKARVVAARVQINNFEQALTQYKLSTGMFRLLSRARSAAQAGQSESVKCISRRDSEGSVGA